MFRYYIAIVLNFLFVVSSMSTPATAQFGPTADQLFERAGMEVGKSDGRAVTATEQIATLRSSGSLVSTPTAQISLEILKDFDRPVWIAGRVRFIDNGGYVEYSKAFYASKSLSLTRFGPGYFPRLHAGGSIPFGEVPTGNAGDRILVEVTLFATDGKPIQTLRTSFWNRLRLNSAGCELVSQLAISVCPIAIESAIVMKNGESIQVVGNFPIGQLLTIGIGDPEWDFGFVNATSKDGRTVLFDLPDGKWGNLLYPRQWPAHVIWSVVISTPDGMTVTAPAILRVQGNSSDYKVAEIK